jgi:hypothetical protein
MDKVEELLDLYELEELFEVLDVTPYEVVTILLRHGYATLPPFLEDDYGTDEE